VGSTASACGEACSAAAGASDHDATVIAPRATVREAAVRWGQAPTSAVAISPGGRLLAVGHPAGTVRVFAAFGAAAATLEVGARPGALAFSRDGAFLAVGGEDGIVRVWPTEALRGSPRLVGEHSPADRPGDRAVTALSFDARDGIASANAAEVRSFGQGSTRSTTLAVPHASAIAQVDGELLTIGAGPSLQAFDAATGKERLPSRGPPR
jgi:WD40 repeat protein